MPAAPAPDGSLWVAVGRVKWLVLAGVVALVVASLGVLAWTRQHHPTTFDYDAYSKIPENDWRPAETLYVGVTFPDPQASGWVRIHSADPHGLADSTDADFSYLICTPRGYAIGSAYAASFPEDCGAAVPALNAKMSLKGQQLVVAITPDHEGRLIFHGIDLNFTDGWQTGTQQVGVTVKMRAVASD